MRTRSRAAISFHPTAWGRLLKAFFQYLFFRRGELSSNLAESGGFIRSDPQEPIPDLQLHVLPLLNSHHALDLRPLFRGYGYSVMIYGLRPLSRGRVRLRSADPLAPSRIDPGFAAHTRDVRRLVLGIRAVRRIVAQSPLAAHNAEEALPGAQCQSDQELEAYVRQTAEVAYHPVGTCKMGGDASAVVDTRLRVRGVAGLRVADASIMPTLIGGNTNAIVTVVGEKCAAMILEDQATPEDRA